MSLTATLRAGVETAFGVAKELVRDGTYITKGGDPVYDPATDNLGSDVRVSGVRMLQTASTVEEREASPVSVNDIKILIPFVDLPGIEPGENDKIDLDGKIYNVLTVKPVPGKAIHIIFCREA